MIWITGIWLVFISVLSHIPGKRSVKDGIVISEAIHMREKSFRSMAHIITYLILTLLALFTFPSFMIWTILGLVTWSAIDEYTKRYIPGRHADIKDWIKNIIGITTGIGIYGLIKI